MDRSDEVQTLMRKARQALDDGRLLLEHERVEGAADRLYYAVFDAARAAVLFQGDEGPKTHEGVKRRFAFHFGRPGPNRLPEQIVRTFGHAEHLRVLADYDPSVRLSLDEVAPLLPQAERFVEAVADLIDA
jgi:uncharacterized protein (UPF0332 family)